MYYFQCPCGVLHWVQQTIAWLKRKEKKVGMPTYLGIRLLNLNPVEMESTKALAKEKAPSASAEDAF